MELLKNFGVEPALFVAQIVNFLIIFYVLKRFAYKPILHVLKNREKSIKEGLQQAEDARILLEETAQKEKDVLKEAQEESKKLLAETKKQRDVILKEAETTAKHQAKKILEEAKVQIAFETKNAQKELSLHISGVAVEFLQKSVAELFSKEDQALIIKNAVEKIRKRAD